MLMIKWLQCLKIFCKDISYEDIGVREPHQGVLVRLF